MFSSVKAKTNISGGINMAHQFFFNPFILDNLPAPATGFDVVQDLSEPRLRMITYILKTPVRNICGDNSHA